MVNGIQLPGAGEVGIGAGNATPGRTRRTKDHTRRTQSEPTFRRRRDSNTAATNQCQFIQFNTSPTCIHLPHPLITHSSPSSLLFLSSPINSPSIMY